jgi:hypothetical protein
MWSLWQQVDLRGCFNLTESCTMAQQHLVDCDDGKRIVLNDLGGSGPTLLMLHAAGFLGKVCY